MIMKELDEIGLLACVRVGDKMGANLFTAQEVADQLGYTKSTAFRKLNALEKHGVVSYQDSMDHNEYLWSVNWDRIEERYPKVYEILVTRTPLTKEG